MQSTIFTFSRKVQNQRSQHYLFREKSKINVIIDGVNVTLTFSRIVQNKCRHRWSQLFFYFFEFSSKSKSSSMEAKSTINVVTICAQKSQNYLKFKLKHIVSMYIKKNKKIKKLITLVYLIIGQVITFFLLQTMVGTLKIQIL
jgi:hypothetical protein